MCRASCIHLISKEYPERALQASRSQAEDGSWLIPLGRAVHPGTVVDGRCPPSMYRGSVRTEERHRATVSQATRRVISGAHPNGLGHSDRPAFDKRAVPRAAVPLSGCAHYWPNWCNQYLVAVK